MVCLPDTQRHATEKIKELFGDRIDLYQIEQQVQYEAQKLANPNLKWERTETGLLKYKVKLKK